MIKTFPFLTLRTREIMRYAKVFKQSEEISVLLSEAVDRIKPLIKNTTEYQFYPVCIEGDTVTIAGVSVRSKDLAKNLAGCKRVMLMAVTLGLAVDREIAALSAIAPSKAVMLDACGVEAVERLCDELIYFVEEQNKVKLRPRYSAGYGDLPLEFQKAIFKLLDCGKTIGLYLNDSMLMSPSKSVTAIVGVED